MSGARLLGALLAASVLLCRPGGAAEPSGPLATAFDPVRQLEHTMWLHSMAALADGGLAMVGNVVGIHDLDLVIAAPDGSHVVALTAPDLLEIEGGLQPAAPSGMFLMATLPPPRGSGGKQPDYLLQVSRIGAEGAVLWTRRFERILDARVMPGGLVPQPDGGAYVVANVVRWPAFTPPDVGERQTRAGYVVRVDVAGNVVWTRLISTGPNAVGLTGAAPAPDGDLFLLAGNTITRLAQNGAVRWARAVSVGAGNNVGFGGMTAVAGGPVVIGWTVQPDPAGLDGLVISLDAEGGLRWARALDVGPDDGLHDAVEGPAGSVVLGGTATRMGPTLEDRVHAPTGWLTALDASGDLAWSGRIGGEEKAHVVALSTRADATYALVAVADGPLRNRSVVVGIPTTGVGGQGCPLLHALPTRVSAFKVDLAPTEIRSTPAELGLSPALLRLQTGEYVAERLCNGE